MELKGTKTEKNLWEAFAGESQARNKYTYFASMAKKLSLIHIFLLWVGRGRAAALSGNWRLGF